MQEELLILAKKLILARKYEYAFYGLNLEFFISKNCYKNLNDFKKLKQVMPGIPKFGNNLLITVQNIPIKSKFIFE